MEHHPVDPPLVAACAGEGTSQHSTCLLERLWSFIATRDVVVKQALRHSAQRTERAGGVGQAFKIKPKRETASV